jgi:high affinity Mn2+ porin
LLSGSAAAQDDASAAAAGAAEDAASAPEAWAAHGQFTTQAQWHGRFRSPYAGPQSLPSAETARQTTDATVFLGMRPWTGGEVYLDQEVDQGHGIGQTLGLAGFSSGDAYKLGKNEPYGRTPRLFLRQVIALGSETKQVDSAANALAGVKSADNVTLTVGKFSVPDVFDDNRFAHDPRADFANWTVIDGGAFDYAADAWGYTVGTAAELNLGAWTGRAGLFALSSTPNATTIDWSGRQHQWIAELERRYVLDGQAGVVRGLLFRTDGEMARYDQATAQEIATGAPADLASLRSYRHKTGVVINVEQALTPALGAFGRWSANDGKTETFEFTDVTRSSNVGLSLRGSAWRRPDDTLGVAAVRNSLSAAGQDFLAHGGLGLLIGDGRLPAAGAERIFEGYYALQAWAHGWITFDAQRFWNPAYNRQRGPLTMLGLRLHAAI